MQIRKRNSVVVGFDAQNIHRALTRAFTAQLGNIEGLNARAQVVTDSVCAKLHESHTPDAIVDIEQVQNYCEEMLMHHGEYVVAKAYILYRQARSSERGSIRLATGTRIFRQDLIDKAVRACRGLDHVNPSLIVDRVFDELFDGATLEQVQQALLLATRPLIEQAPEYSNVTANLLLDQMYYEVLGVRDATPDQVATGYASYFRSMLEDGIAADQYDARLLDFDIARLSAAIKPERDGLYDYLGMQTLYDRYLVDIGGKRIELPQTMLMRIAMGLSFNEDERTGMALAFYDLLSTHDYMASTPTLFNAGRKHPQLSSCYLTTVPDDLAGIFAAYRDNALLSKYAGGIGNDWTPVRSLGAMIKGTNGQSQGVVPFLKIDNDTAIAVNQGGKRKGAICSYLESWHMDIEEFLELRKNTGDERRRTHDMNTANWIPDLFMERVLNDQNWTLFSPNDCPDLHDLTGDNFRVAYMNYELMAERGEIKAKKIQASGLWRKMLSMLFETGHAWITFKDPCNLRSPQQHAGVVHSSNLCTEITLNTKQTTYDEYGERNEIGEIAVCNLGSINLPNHIDKLTGEVLVDKLERTVKLAVRMLDNVIDLNKYPVPEARLANMRHRPVGLGFMGFQDVLYLKNVSYADARAVTIAGELQELIAYYAINASADLAEERGSYTTFEGSDWSNGILPMDTAQRLANSRGEFGSQVRVWDQALSNLPWDAVRERVTRGMRNSNIMAIAPTATIANITGVTPGNEPTYKNLYVKNNLSGDFTVINQWLVRDLRALGLWDAQMLSDLKRDEGSVQNIARVPEDLRHLYRTAFDIVPEHLVDCAVERNLFIDQGQSLNLYMAGVSGKKLDHLYRYAWLRGAKTTYYLRALAASGAEKSTGHLPATPQMPEPEGPACTMRPGDVGFEAYEACQ